MAFLRRYVFHDIGLKLFSLLMAVCLWAAVSAARPDHAGEVPWKSTIELRNIPQGLEISSVSLPEAKMWLSAPSRVLDRMGSSDVRVGLDLSNAQAGDHMYSLDARNVQVPAGVHVKQFEPAHVQIRLDAHTSRVVEVRPRVVGRLASGFAITKVVADPSQITVAGPAERVAMVDSAVTDPVDATGLLSPRTFTTSAYVPDPLVHVVNPRPVRVTVFVRKSSWRQD
jgi:diadenylate cyclase